MIHIIKGLQCIPPYLFYYVLFPFRILKKKILKSVNFKKNQYIIYNIFFSKNRILQKCEPQINTQ